MIPNCRLCFRYFGPRPSPGGPLQKGDTLDPADVAAFRLNYPTQRASSRRREILPDSMLEVYNLFQSEIGDSKAN
jgi:hypothetical protein